MSMLVCVALRVNSRLPLLERVHNLDIRKLRKISVRRVDRADAVLSHQCRRANVEEDVAGWVQ